MAATETVYAVQLVQGTVVTRSVRLDAPATRLFVGALDVSAIPVDVLASLEFVLTLQASLNPGIWLPVATQEWPENGDRSSPPAVRWHGLARRARLMFEPSAPASVGATITTN